jgi:hypothetical protein
MGNISSGSQDYARGIVSRIAPRYERFPLPLSDKKQLRDHGINQFYVGNACMIQVHFKSPQLKQLRQQLASMIVPTMKGKILGKGTSRWIQKNRLSQPHFGFGIHCDTAEQATRGRKELMQEFSSRSTPIQARGLRLIMYNPSPHEHEMLYEHIFGESDENS